MSGFTMGTGSRVFGGLLLGSLLTTSPLSAQGGTPAQDRALAAHVAMTLRTKGSVGESRAILRQLQQARSEEVLDAVAESLVDYIVSKASSTVNLTSQRQAVDVLAASGRREGGGKPYPGAYPRLLRIVETADDTGLRGRALFAIAHQPDTAQALRMLRSVAVSNNPAAMMAVRDLAGYLGERGLGVLRELHKSGEVKDLWAQRELAHNARKYGWTR